MWIILSISPLATCLALNLVIAVDASMGGTRGTSVLLCLTSLSKKVIADLADNTGLISSVKGGKDNISGGADERTSAESGDFFR